MDEFPLGDFLQDFLDESSEHIENIQRHLLDWEELFSSAAHDSPEGALQRVTLVNELFRSFHTLKGLCGMVGLAQAEQLSHQMESVLRAVQRAEIEPRPEMIDPLLEGTRRLASQIETLTNPQQPPLPIEPAMAALQAVLPAPPAHQPPVTASPAPPAAAAAAPAGPEAEIQDLLDRYPDLAGAINDNSRHLLRQSFAQGEFLSLAIFSPSPEKSAQGTNVTQVRQQLSQAGVLILAAPLPGPDGIRFAFLVASKAPLDPAGFVALDWQIVRQGVVQPAPLSTTAAAPAPPAAIATAATVRVDLARLDELMQLVSDLVVARSRLAGILPRLQGAQPQALSDLEQTLGKIERSLRDLRQAVVRTRMVPMAEIFGAMPLAVRDLARASGKEVHMQVDGEGHEVDKMLVERLLDPLLHLVRNAIVHGLETPAERLAAGKPRRGTLRLSAHPEGDQMLIEVTDDGRGIDFQAVADKAAGLGWTEPVPAGGTAPALSETQVLEWILRPGFSTRLEADLGSGRGVGLDVVQRAVASLGGSLGFHSEPGQGTTFLMRLPLTLSIVDALLVRSNGQQYAIPQNAVLAVIEIEPEKVYQAEDTQLYPYQGSSLTLTPLARLFSPGAPPGRARYGLISVEGGRRTALVVDGLVGMREVVVRPVKDPLVARPGISGATELGDGSVILILELASLFQHARRRAHH